ncbi:uncharacterized protein I206_105129 [Kwoniella pini CBS 10737]|uniref:GTPase activator n=1 Tax=Kwoniella pini CBS 10737 TaxID=1296096 RepID=A0A1B9I905_9TREE|nr:uncharacterized protein I206_02671 [Kwoniella pini CBS 10737]OCF51954.1 hypothetical protein I206_02671 [Kwoniella pini CBS 10737]
MSPVPPPPPAGAFVPSDDWSEDPSFDLSPSAHHFALPTSPSSSSTSSTSHRSHHSISSTSQHASSPLRQSYTTKGTIKLKKGQDIEELLDGFDDDFDLPDTLPNQTLTGKSRPRPSISSSITRTVVGNGPTGIGTITKLGSTTTKTPIIKGMDKSRALAIERSWEADVDFEDALSSLPIEALPLRSASSSSVIRRMTLSPPRKGFMPSADALDDLGFDLEDEDQATLKAGATLKAMLPPRNDPTLRPSRSTNNIINVPSTPPAQDPDSIELESDFALPLNLTNLTLATQPRQSSKLSKQSKPRQSDASTTTNNTESWGSPSSGAKKWGWGSEDSPSNSGINKRRSETSATSISDCLPETSNESRSKDILVQPNDELGLDEEENMENGLVLPSPTFFSNKRSKELNSILDKKRKPQYAPTVPNHHQHTSNQSFKRGHQADDSFEDGLVLDEPGVELSKHRLRSQKQARDKFPSSTLKMNSTTLETGASATRGIAKEREKAREKQREQGWGRVTPVPLNPSRERTQSSLGLSFRSNSASATTLLRENTKRVDSPSLTGREKESMRSRSGHIHSMLPPPIPSTSQLPPLPPPTISQQTPTSRLRHQKSHYHIAAPPQSPSLTRKQSLASLQDALADKTFTITDTPRYQFSTSRLTMPTSSSKAKSRPPISSIFPTSISGPSSSSMSIANQYNPSQRGESVRKVVDMPRRNKTWGDGSELDGIDDLDIDDDHKSTIKGSGISGIGLGKPGRRSLETSHPFHRTTLVSTKSPPVSSDLTEKRKKSGSGTTLAKRKHRKPALIKHFGVADKKKVVGEMTWNPSTLRWEGNESILRDFDTVSSSARPALITHYTGSSIGGLSSPVGSTASAPRIVGDMQFDPVHMKWISILSPEDDEPDPFEGMADDEDEDLGGGTITRSSGKKFLNKFVTTSNNWTSRLISESSIASSTTTQNSLNSTAWEGANLISDELWKECKSAEERHKKEMKGWIMRSTSSSTEIRERERKESKRLWEIRNLAMKS